MRNLRPAGSTLATALDVLTETTGAAPAEAPAAIESERTHNGVPLDQPLREARDQFGRVYVEFHLSRENVSMTRVADRAGLERTHLYRKLKQLGIELARGTRRDRPIEDIVTAAAPSTSTNPPRPAPVYVQRDDYDD